MSLAKSTMASIPTGMFRGTSGGRAVQEEIQQRHAINRICGGDAPEPTARNSLELKQKVFHQLMVRNSSRNDPRETPVLLTKRLRGHRPLRRAALHRCHRSRAAPSLHRSRAASPLPPLPHLDRRRTYVDQLADYLREKFVALTIDSPTAGTQA